ncbi:uncharacterized protein LOC126985252 [Eriocheir sinensis]|uniref:uncharacterized protein LOC126985252 n=1 Tax=Eriocheir sinensis TaxID=95602 RepID=UPI0021C5F956|nr:uncharacterized protein LOC126985252 [Eriocheir sinensis]
MKVAAAVWAAAGTVLCLAVAVRGADFYRAEAKGEDERDERIFAIRVHTSVTRLASTTLSALSTCLSVVTSTACNGRKKREFYNQLEALEGPYADTDFKLSGSMDEEGAEEEEVTSSTEEEEEEAMEGEAVTGRDGKKLTIWSTSLTTLTITSTSYIPGTTITASAFCTAPGITEGCFG